MSASEACSSSRCTGSTFSSIVYGGRSFAPTPSSVTTILGIVTPYLGHRLYCVRSPAHLARRSRSLRRRYSPPACKNGFTRHFTGKDFGGAIPIWFAQPTDRASETRPPDRLGPRELCRIRSSGSG